MTYQTPSGFPGPPGGGRSVQPYGAAQQQYGLPAPDYSMPAPPPPAPKRKWPWIVGGTVVVAILGVGLYTLVLGGTDPDPPATSQAAAAGKMGQAATDGGFQFMVSGMKCGAKSVGGDLLGHEAKGQFCILDVQIKNVGGAAEKFDHMPQKVYDAEKNEYTADAVAGTYANTDQPTFLADINPGSTMTGELVFDVPPGTKPTSVELHESMSTPGVRVPLT
jgi:hypothetical protein